jgi:hypothetical protein
LSIMSDVSNDQNTEGEEKETSSSSLSGKGWEILVGGKDKPLAMGGSDPFDLGDASNPAEGPQSPKGARKASEPAPPEPRDLTPEELGYVPASPTPVSPIDEMPAGLSEAASSQSEEGSAPAMPGLSAGVTVTPIVSSIVEVPPPPTPDVEAVPSGEAVPSSTIIEVAPPSETSAPAAPPVGGPVVPPEGQVPEDVLVGPVAPSPGTVLPIPSTPPWPVPQSVAIHDPFDTLDERPRIDEEAELVPDAALAKTLITQERIDALWEEINKTYDLAVNDVRGHFNTTQQSLGQLKKARYLGRRTSIMLSNW